MKEFVHLHNHSHYSILDGVSKIDQIVSKAKEYNQKALALTDHGNMFGNMEFYSECNKKGIKPIFGCEVYLAPENRYIKNKDEKYYHLVLLAKDKTGFKNLIKLVSIGYLEGFYYKPRIDKEVLREHSEGLIALSACLGGELPSYILANRIDKFKEAISWYIDVFGKENFFLEIQNHNLEEEKIVNPFLINYSKRNDIKLVATNDSHYINTEDSLLQEILFAIRDKTTLSDPNRYRFPNNTFDFCSTEKIIELFSDIPEAIDNTLLITEMCNFDMKSILPKSATESEYLPKFNPPEGYDSYTYLKEACYEGLKEKFKDREIPEEYKIRLDNEIELIRKMGFCDYFLIVAEYINYAKNNGIYVGPGRGSAAGALVSYSLGITNVDPVKYGLLFERFLNPERVTMPDIDTDFEDSRRDEVKEYLRRKYGYDKTANIITFGVLKPKAALTDTGRVLEIPLERVRQITKLIDNKLAQKSFKEIYESVPEIKDILENGSEIEKKWIKYSEKLDNTIRDIGSHASGVIISNSTLTEIVPLYKDSNDTISTQYEGSYLEENGLLKMDVLGLANLSIIKDCINRIQKNHQVKIDLDNIPLDDKKVYEDIFWKGDTKGIFQFESDGMTAYLKKLKPTCIDDLIAMNALYRPGPIDFIPQYINRKHGHEEVDCYHKDLEPILKPTYGVIVYQEQVMQIAQVLAGFSLGKADKIRRIMSKKKQDELLKIKPEWIEGCKKKGYSEELANKIFDILVPFSEYAFNKSHSACYAILAYQIAYLKTYYRLEFMTSLLSYNNDDSDSIKLYCEEAIRYGIKIIPPDINKSEWNFKEDIKSNEIIFGFCAVKGLGESISEKIIEEREKNGPYKSFDDFINRFLPYPEFKKSSIEILIKVGAFDSLFENDDVLKQKSILLNTLENIIEQKLKSKKEDELGIISLFDSNDLHNSSINTKKIKPITIEEDFKNEIAILGFYLSGKIYKHYEKQFGELSDITSTILQNLNIKTNCLASGLVMNISNIRTSSYKNQQYVFFELLSKSDKFEFLLFGDKFILNYNKLKEGDYVLINFEIGNPRKDSDLKQYDLKKIITKTEILKQYFTELHIVINTNEAENEEILESIKSLSNFSEKNNNSIGMNLCFHIISGNTTVDKKLNNIKLKYSDKLIEHIKNLKGYGGFWVI